MVQTQVVNMSPETWAFVTRHSGVRPQQIGAAVDKAFDELTEKIARGGVRTQGAPRARYHYRDGEQIGFDLGFPIAPADVAAAHRAGLATGETLSGEALTTTHQGPYENLAQTYRALEADMKERGIAGQGAVWEVYLNDPDDTPRQDLLTQIFWPIERPA